MRWAILDTSIYINHWEGRLAEDALLSVRRAFIVRQSSVVLSELRRGARTPRARRLVETLFRLAKIQWAPGPSDWWEAGRIVRKIGDALDWDTHKRQAFQNDALIALTARRYGAAVVTADRMDFELLAAESRISILVVRGAVEEAGG
jgi:predicted nucleic acid-binding protein